MQTLLLLIQSPQVEVLGITVVSGDAWRDEEVAHTLRLLEIIGRTDIPVMKGAAFPLVRTREEHPTLAGSLREGVVCRGLGSALVPRPLRRAASHLKDNPRPRPLTRMRRTFLIRMVHKYPNEVTIYEGGPMTNLAVALTLDSHFAELAQELVFMGGSLNPQTS